MSTLRNMKRWVIIIKIYRIIRRRRKGRRRVRGRCGRLGSEVEHGRESFK
jgi:hypothetical protein